ncbi:MAG: hypothetical protein HOJ67_08725, partial [Rhodospirillaceae bacterium]|nr:hypothetical protein [Rhodospirillaceae bacterium]
MADLTYSRRNNPRLTSNFENVGDVAKVLLDEYEKNRKKRGKRKVNEGDKEDYHRHLVNIICDLYAAWIENPDRYVGYSRGKENFNQGGSYWDHLNDCSLLSQRKFLELIDFLKAELYIEDHTAKAGRNRFSSRMKAKEYLLNLLFEMEVNWASIQTDTNTGAIVVKDKNKKIIDPPKDPDFDYSRAEKNLQRINENLQSSLLNLNISDKEFEVLKARLRNEGGDDELEALGEYREPLDFSNRSLRRIFSLDSFEYGGRFYGGWWQGVPSEYRKFIEIEGLMTNEKDYATNQARILYGEVNAEAPDDSYVIPGWNIPDWNTELRIVTKKAFNQLLNSKEINRNEEQWWLFAPDLAPNPMPKNWKDLKKKEKNWLRRTEFRKQTGRDYSELLRDLKEMHKPIDKFFFSQAWAWIQRRDSDIAERVMLKLLDEQITALPIHDSFIVRRGAEKILKEVMNETFEEILGVKAKLHRDDSV